MISPPASKAVIDEIIQLQCSNFTLREAELAQKIANDISENIDSGESRIKLRRSLAYWVWVATDEARRRAEAESKLNLARSAHKLLLIAFNDRLDPSD